MILEYVIDYRSSSLVYEKIFLKSLKQHSLEGKILKDGFSLRCYVQAEDAQGLEDFATDFAKKLPHSIFLYGTAVNVVEDMPEGEYVLADVKKPQMPFCLECLESVLNESGEDYYNIFKSCDICGYDAEGEHKSYKDEIQKIAQDIKDGKIVKVDTLYGSYNVGKISEICNKINFDIIAYDYATLQEYTHAKDYELKALASMEKPLVRLKTNMKFKTDVEDLQEELIRFKLPDDFVLYLLLRELKEHGVDMIFVTKDEIQSQSSFCVVQRDTQKEPIEVVVSKKYVAIVGGNKGLPEFDVLSTSIAPIVGATYSVIKEHGLKEKEIAGIYLSKKYQNGIVMYGKKYGMVNYLSLECSYSSINDIFEKIKQTDLTAKKLVENYMAKFPQHCERILNLSFEKDSFTMYEFWGVLAIILDLCPSDNLDVASKLLQNNSISFLGSKGPRIDYKIIKDTSTSLDCLMIVRSAMSFKLAGIDNLTLSYGIVESFAEFLTSEIEDIKDGFNIDSIAVSGSLLQNNRFFAKLADEASINSNIYFNNQLPVDEKNITYGDYVAK